MPTTGPVYQPTTVSYEQQGEWTSPTGFLSQTNNSIGRARWLQWVALALALLGIASGLIMIIEGSVDFSDTRQHDEEIGTTPAIDAEYNKSDMVIIITGCLLLFVGLALMAIYIRLSTRRKGCPCLLTKEQRIARQLRDTQSVNGQTMNPSTDFLVTAQYAPVSEIAYQPPAVSEEEETRKLMGSDNKDCSDDNERILDKDPRIVLRPLSKVEESQDSEESNSVITLNPGRFEPEDSPEPRRLGYYPRTSTNPGTVNPRTFDLDKTPSMKRASSWKTSIMRKASVRSRKAPLAGVEELTPSLRSSWSSVYFNHTPSESESEGLSQTSDSV